jgi:hypothetical protein
LEEKKMFWKSKEKEQTKLSRPRDLPEIVKKQIESNRILDTDSLPFLKATVKQDGKGEKSFDILIYDPSDAEARGVKVDNYDSLKANPQLIMAEGFYNESDKKVELVTKQDISKNKFFTEDEIQKQIEGLTTPGSSVFFFVNAGTGSGGPLGRGCAIVKLNAPVEGKKIKKYGIYGASVVDMLPTNTENKIFDSDKPKDIMKWIATSHKPRFC